MSPLVQSLTLCVSIKSEQALETIEECDQNHHLIQSLIRPLSLCIYFTNKVFCLIEGVAITRKMEQEGLDVHNNRNADHYGTLAHHLSLIHNKRCLMAYVSVRYHFSFCYQRLSQFVKNDIGVGVCRHNRADIVRDLAWRVGLELLDLPPEIQDKLTTLEKRVLQEPFCSYQIVHGKSRNRVECRKQFGFNFAWWGLYYTTRVINSFFFFGLIWFFCGRIWCLQKNNKFHPSLYAFPQTNWCRTLHCSGQFLFALLFPLFPPCVMTRRLKYCKQSKFAKTLTMTTAKDKS